MGCSLPLARDACVPRLRRTWAPFAIAVGLSVAAPLHAGDWTPICRAIRDQSEQLIVPDGSGGAYVGWIDQRTGYTHDVYVQHVGPQGPLAGWPVDGYPAAVLRCSQRDLAIATDDSGGVLAAWTDDRCVGPHRIFTQRI